jgi:hypothetical protein|tara:strand:+ start:107 stop:538 length:432 start_codon:yes stop_codon:yes gene_type:complete
MWKCKKCEEKIEDTFDTCWNCGYEKTGKEIMSDSFEETKIVMSDSFEETKIELPLYYKYSYLKTYKGMCYIVMLFLSIGFVKGIIGLNRLSGIIKSMVNVELSIIGLYFLLVVSYLSFLVVVYAIIILINFLFDLDNTKLNNE